MDKELLCSGNPECASTFCQKDLLKKVLLSFLRPSMNPVINRIFEVPELFVLAEVVSLGENQLHHVIRMAEYADLLSEALLARMGITREDLIDAVLFHDIGKGEEVDDRNLTAGELVKTGVPAVLKKYGLPNWVEFKKPIHGHIVKGIEIAEQYKLPARVIESIALHHHVKLKPVLLKDVADALFLAPMIRRDILQHQPEQYAVKGSAMAQVLAILDQICAIERKFNAKISLGLEPDKLEDELVRDLIIGVAHPNDPRMKVLGRNILGKETVILLDISAFGTFVQLHSEYEVQATKRTVLNTVRSLIRGWDDQREMDLVGLIGGDEFAIITTVDEEPYLKKIIERICAAVKAKTGFNLRVGYGLGATIYENFHEARHMANMKKKRTFIK